MDRLTDKIQFEFDALFDAISDRELSMNKKVMSKVQDIRKFIDELKNIECPEDDTVEEEKEEEEPG